VCSAAGDFFFDACATAAQVKFMRIILHGKDLAVPEMTGPMSAAVLKGALNHLLAQEVNYVNAVALAKDLGLVLEVSFTQVSL